MEHSKFVIEAPSQIRKMPFSFHAISIFSLSGSLHRHRPRTVPRTHSPSLRNKHLI